MNDLDDSRAELRARQGAGARYDALAAPTGALAQMRLGTAYFARLLNGLNDRGLEDPSSDPSLSRAHVVALIGVEARKLGEALAMVRAGLSPVTMDMTVGRKDLDRTATLPPRALRHLFKHSAVHLNVELRDLCDEDWGRSVSLPNGQTIAVIQLPAIRAQSLWARSRSLGAGGKERD